MAWADDRENVEEFPDEDCTAELAVKLDPDDDLDVSQDTRYDSMRGVLDDALEHAATGKGEARHGTDEPFEEQITCYIERAGLSFCEGQAVKKLVEAHRTGDEEDKLGAINYIVANILVSRETRKCAGTE